MHLCGIMVPQIGQEVSLTCSTSFNAMTSLFYKSVRFSIRAWANNPTRNIPHWTATPEMFKNKKKGTNSCQNEHDFIKVSSDRKPPSMSNQPADFLVPCAAGSLLDALRRYHGDEIKVWWIWARSQLDTRLAQNARSRTELSENTRQYSLNYVAQPRRNQRCYLFTSSYLIQGLKKKRKVKLKRQILC